MFKNILLLLCCGIILHISAGPEHITLKSLRSREYTTYLGKANNLLDLLSFDLKTATEYANEKLDPLVDSLKASATNAKNEYIKIIDQAELIHNTTMNQLNKRAEDDRINIKKCIELSHERFQALKIITEKAIDTCLKNEVNKALGHVIIARNTTEGMLEEVSELKSKLAKCPPGFPASICENEVTHLATKHLVQMPRIIFSEVSSVSKVIEEQKNSIMRNCTQQYVNMNTNDIKVILEELNLCINEEIDQLEELQ